MADEAAPREPDDETGRAPPVDPGELGLQSASWCRQPPRSTCDFYLACLEADKPCGVDGYAQSYGDKYCRRFDAEAGFSPAGAIWRDETLSCLQYELVRYLGDSRATCEEVTEAAFDSHPRCYTLLGCSICDLPAADWRLIVATVDAGDYLSLRSARQIYETGTTCLGGWIFSLRSTPGEPRAEDEDVREKVRILEELGAKLGIAPPGSARRAP